MTREEKIEKMVQNDIDDIRQAIHNEDYVFVANVLTGNCWVPYNQLSDDGVDNEHHDRFADEIDEEEDENEEA